MQARKRPAHGVYADTNGAVVVFVTVCTKDRVAWLADGQAHALLRSVWNDSGAWVVGRYVLMPDHLHLFAAPGEAPTSLDAWVRYWKSRFSRANGTPGCWQTDHWDTRLRSEDSYEAKWEYVRNNPVRAGLVACASDWPFQGELNYLEW